MKHCPARLLSSILIASLSLIIATSASPQTQTPPGQESPQPIPIIKTTVREVLVPVVVTDSKGHHVTNLKQSDFKVFEDGVPEDIVAFRTTTDSSAPLEPGKTTGPPSASGSTPPPHPDAAANPVRTYLIVIDALHSAPSGFTRVRDALVKVLRQEQGSDSQYALMALGRQLKVVHDSTSDAAAIAAAARAPDFQTAFQDSEATNTAAAIQQFTALMRSYCSACLCESNGGTSQLTECASFQSRVRAALLGYDERMYVLNHNFLLTLRELVKATASMPTARTIILISDGFNRFPGRELYSVLRAFAPKDHIFEANSRDTQPELQSILQLATKYDVKFYTLDSRGVYNAVFNGGNTFVAGTSFSTHTQMDSRNAPSEATATTESVDRGVNSTGRENADVLAQLAHETGGLFFENNNDLQKGITKAFADTREYYLLAYVSKNEAFDGKFRKITVETNDNRKFRVNAKAGYWATEK
jgi:VWFA-related protein